MAEAPTTERSASPWRTLALQLSLLAVVLAALAWRARPDSALRVVFIEGRGDAALIQTPAGGFVLLDGGGDPAALAGALGRHLPFWRRSLDAVVLSNGSAAPLAGQVAALARYPARLAIVPPAQQPGALLSEWRQRLRADGTQLHVAQAGERIVLGGAQLQVLEVGVGIEAGMLLRLEYGATSLVLDLRGAAAGQLPAGLALRRADALAFPWEHDPRAPLVAALRPHALVFTDGAPADRPAELTFHERAPRTTRLYHERLNGAITWQSDGLRAYIITER